MTRFPPELQQRVARWCPVDEFLAMMLLNRASYLNLLASFYKIVVVDSTIQFNKLADTILTDRKLAGRTSSLRLLPLGLVVTIPYRYNAVAPDTSVVKKVLHALPNIKQLILKLSSSGLEELFQHGGLSDVPFKLQDFHCKLVTGIFDFLRHQTTLTFFNVLDGVPLNKEQMALISAEPNRMLPKVRKLTGHWSSVNVFIPDRPVSCLTNHLK
ncbi:hypothetical protein FRC09_011101 [Ceratobasidium sp. 395]|nr:hypothetical protein FRC09_011101 [Ceratobasidium sp. 395]